MTHERATPARRITKAVIADQAVQLRHTLLWICFSVTIVMGSVVVTWLLTGIRPGTLTRDPAVVVEEPFYIGYTSNLGMILWSISVGISFFTAHVLSRIEHSERDASRFALTAGLVTLWLLLDDMFMFHEDVFPLRLGLSEHIVYLFTFALLVALVVRFLEIILQSDYLLLVLVMAGWGMSVVIDIVESFVPLRGTIVLEDGAKFAGIVSWLVYLTRTCMSFLVRAKTNDN